MRNLNLPQFLQSPRIPPEFQCLKIITCNGLNLPKLNNQSKFNVLKFEITRPIQSKKELLQMRTLNLIFHDTRFITPKSLFRVSGPHLRVMACVQHSSFRSNVAAMASCWQHYVRFVRPEI